MPELVTITNIKMDAKGYKMTDDATKNLVGIISAGTTAELRSKYNGRLIDNMLQWASDAMNTRLPLDASGDDLITLHKSDFANAMVRFKDARPPTKVDPTLVGGREVETQLQQWGLSQYSELFVRAGYRQLFDLLALQSEKDIRALGVTKDADVRRAMTLVHQLAQQHREMSLKMDALYIDPDTLDIRTWLEKRNLGEFANLFEEHKVRHAPSGPPSAPCPTPSEPRRPCSAQREPAISGRLRNFGRPDVRRYQGDRGDRDWAEAEGVPRHRGVEGGARYQKGRGHPRQDVAPGDEPSAGADRRNLPAATPASSLPKLPGFSRALSAKTHGEVRFISTGARVVGHGKAGG